ncbi:pyridoxal phosphate-dependent aminotransferase [Salinicoccus hispanicus]|uniref:Aminotransferase class I/II-fold pyridoxal phosphate-dependent enzyme n=2 Tax=Salinicoccus hispanicus TaxID=157225 RepID=A0A6N8U4U7_9STAP|nr:aminotransferase class I/II-fold pyridoxal phosphate-dependent enzyme [Salinicoccus hispanicus]
MIHMDRNTSPISPLDDEAISEVIKATKIHEYPGDEIDNFKQLYADYYDIEPATIEVANGSDEWIQKAIMTLGHNGVMTLDPDFVMYHEYANQVDVPVYTVSCDADFTFDFDQVIKAVELHKPSLFLISVPHNPTGRMFRAEELQALADAMQDVDGYLVLDEAYFEFGPAYTRPEGAHVLIIRTLSKMFGVAGLRIGIAIAKDETFDKITRLNHPYPVNSLSLNLASKIFEKRSTLDVFIRYQLDSKKRLSKSLGQVSDKINIIGSSTNFILTYGETARDLAAYLKSHGYQARVYDKPPLENAVRYSIIGLEHYETFNQLIKKWSNQYDQEGTRDKGNENIHIT